MQIQTLKYRILKDNSYLLVISVLMLALSLFTQRSVVIHSEKAYASVLQAYISSSQGEFQRFYSDTVLVNRLVAGSQTEEQTAQLAAAKQYFFIYKNVEGFNGLSFWNTQAVLPGEDIISFADTTGMAVLQNGRYFLQKYRQKNIMIISLLPVKWNYFVSNDYLKNDFAVHEAEGKNFEISFTASRDRS